MDLVISIDTSVAHLTGALGKPLWLLLPFHPDFRWLRDREDSPWYPTAKLFRQTIRWRLERRHHADFRAAENPPCSPRVIGPFYQMSRRAIRLLRRTFFQCRHLAPCCDATLRKFNLACRNASLAAGLDATLVQRGRSRRLEGREPMPASMSAVSASCLLVALAVSLGSPVATAASGDRYPKPHHVASRAAALRNLWMA